MNDLVCVVPPVAEPVSVGDMLTQLGLGEITDEALVDAMDAQLGGYIAAAREMCETYTRSVYSPQTWLWKLDGFPRWNRTYDHRHRGPHGTLLLPKPPFQSIVSVQYVDTMGVLQTLPPDTTNGSDPSLPAYAYQLDPGSTTQRARLNPAWSRFWPTTRHVQSAVQVRFICGYPTAPPPSILQAIKMQAQFFYEQGGVVDMPLPRVITALLDAGGRCLVRSSP